MKDIFSNIGYYDILWPGLLVKKVQRALKLRLSKVEA